MPIRDIVLTIIVFGSLPFIIRNPAFGIIMWCWMGFMNPHKLCWGFSTHFYYAQLIAISTLISILISKESKTIPWTRETIFLLLFILWMFITTLFAFNQTGAWYQLDKVWKIQLMIFMTLMMMRTPERVNALVWVTVLSIGLYGIKGGIFTIMTGGQYMVLGPAGTFIGVRGGIALALNMTLPLMRYLQLTVKMKWMRYGFTIAMVLTALAVIGTQSRGALLGIIAMGGFLILKTRKKFLYIIVAGIVAFSIVSFMPTEWHERMGTINTYEEDGSAMGRINAWWFAWNLASDYPITGGGFECFRGWLFDRYAPEPDNVHDAHNIFFEVLGEHGFVGLFFFLSLMVMTWRSGTWIIKNVGKFDDLKWMSDLARMIQVSIVAYVAGGSFLGLAYFDYYYHLIAIVVLCKSIILKRIEAEVTLDVPADQNIELPLTEPVRT